MKPTGGEPLEHAQVAWDEHGQPLSSTFGDVYFSRVNGLAETRHVFLQHNQLPARLSALRAPRFTIAETGFGSGLNFLATWQLWQRCAPADAHLHFISVEKYPLTCTDLARALALWPELSDYADALIAAYPALLNRGFHRLDFGRVHLTLIIDDAAQGLAQLLASEHPLFHARGTRVDAWFLDGFAPAKNPQMWSAALFACLAQLSAPGTTAATFSAAGIVKRGLQSVGFEVAKVPGFGRKRDMLSARYTGLPHTSIAPDGYRHTRGNAPWPLPWALERQPPDRHRREALVIGAGLAGCHSARALAERGWQVTLLERADDIAQGASGNPQGILYAKLSPRPEPQGLFNLACLQYAQRHYRPLWQHGREFGQACGVLQLAHTPAEAELQEQLKHQLQPADTLIEFVSAARASELAGLPLDHGGLYFPQAGWLNPPQVCRHLLEHPNIALRTGCAVAHLNHSGKHWCALDAQGQVLGQAPVVVLANASDALQLAQTRDLPLKAIRGQVSYLPSNPHSNALRAVVCSEGYLAPAEQGYHCAGASFNLGSQQTDLNPEDHRTNLAQLAHHGHHLQALFAPLAPGQLGGRVGFRCASRDYLPLVGPAPQADAFDRDYAILRKNARASLPLAGSYWPGLYLNLAHGSRGLAYTPLCAQLLAAQITGDPLPLARDLTLALHPARFIIRDLIRNKR